MKENQLMYIYSNTDSTKKQVTLRNPIGVWFSQLDGNREERGFYYCFSQNEDDRHNAFYRYYGDLPDGRHFGAYVFSSMTSWADFKDPPFTGIVIVEENGKMQTSTPAEQMHLQPDEHYFPTAIVASPSGKTLVWITKGELWSWHMVFPEKLFLTDDGEKETRFGGRKVRDARMHADGILEVLLEDGETFGIFCDEYMFLKPFEGGWIPGDEAAAGRIERPMNYWPESLILMIRKEDTGWQAVNNVDSIYYNNCSVRRVCFEPGLEVIKRGILAMNYELETLVIPAFVKQVESFAFGCCENLKNLTIEGDLSRVANWAEDAFDGCGCEGYYKQLKLPTRKRAMKPLK